MPLKLEQFHFYDPASETRRTRQNLPHWEQRGVSAFSTWRMADSLPACIMQGWLDERDAWLRKHGLDPDNETWRDALEDLPGPTVREFHRTFTRRMHAMLDAGHGSCLLRRAELRRVVEDSLMHWQGERCLLAGWVIMPNHVHVLMQPMPGHGLLKLSRSIKQWTARHINALTGERGEFWQSEGWDHLLRRPAYLRAFRKYIRLNPVKPRLRADEYTLCLPEIEGLEE